MSAPLVSTDESPAVRFGRFVILEKAGEGAMGTVYAAYDPDLDRRVALKVLRSSTAGRQQERIRREALAMARVSHPNVVQIYEVGEHDGRLFIAMQFVDGTTLSAWQAEPRGWRAVVRLYVEIARGLAAAHGSGLVHRDFKPDNVLVDRDGRPRIIDFGLARAAGEATTDEMARVEVSPVDGDDPRLDVLVEIADTVATADLADAGVAPPRRARGTPSSSRRATPEPTPRRGRGLGSLDDLDSPSPYRHFRRGHLVGSNDLLAHELTRTGHIMGTPAYMAPELMADEAPTPRSDQFAFGVAFYEALCGQPPFARDSLVGLKLAVMRGEVRPPPTDRELPGPLARVLLRTLTPDPARRFPSMHALIAALERLVDDDELVDYRPRIAIVVLLGLVLGLGALSQSSGGTPLTVGTMIRSELAISAFVLLALVPFHRVLRATSMHRRAVYWLFLMTPAKVLLPVVGAVHGVEPTAIRAFDTVLVVVMTGVAVGLIHRPLWPAMILTLACLVAMLIEPAWTTALYGVANMSLLLVVGVRAVTTIRRVRARGPALARRPGERSAQRASRASDQKSA